MSSPVKLLVFILSLFVTYHVSKANFQVGPDPWNYDKTENRNDKHYHDIPPDLRYAPKKKISQNNLGPGEWFFRRMLTIVLRGASQNQKRDDKSVDISLHMKFSENHWKVLNDYIQSSSPLTEDMLRRAVGYVEQSIHKPSIIEQITVEWNEWICSYLVEYKTHLQLLLGLLAGAYAGIWMWNHMSHKHALIIVFILLYLYEVFISYKEAEKAEVQRFIDSMNACKWYFWRSECDIPLPDPLVFVKHMNPLKIFIRMFTTLVTEPMLTISETLKIMIHGITDGLWYPFDKIVYGILFTVFNVLLLFLLIMIIFNYILNIPFSLSFLGLVSVGVKQRRRSIFTSSSHSHNSISDNTDRISGANLNKLLNVVSAITNGHSQGFDIRLPKPASTRSITMKRSASTGRLPSLLQSENNDTFANDIPSLRKRTNGRLDGSGDAR